MKLIGASQPGIKRLEDEVGRFCFAAWDSPTVGRLLVLAGSNGTGKTHCAKAVRDWIRLVGHGRTFLKQQNQLGYLDCIYWHWPMLLDTFKNGGWDAVDDMFSVSVLIIDDLGAGHDPSAVGTDKLCQVLSRRERMWTLITTNIMPPAWQQKFDRRVASRLVRNSTLVDLTDVPDYHG